MKSNKEQHNKNCVECYDFMIWKGTHTFYDTVSDVCVERNCTKITMKAIRNVFNFVRLIFTWNEPPKR